MRKIDKGNPLQEFSDFILSKRPTIWGDLPDAIRINIRAHILIEEQDCLCGYTELPIDYDNTSSHIDHYKKRSLFSNLCFDWNNLLVASTDDDFGARYKDMHYIKEKNQYSFLLNPVIDNPNNFFEYTTWGEITPKKSGLTKSKKQKAEETILAFNLNHLSLVQKRENLIKVLNSYKSQFTLDDMLRHLNRMGFTSLIEFIY